MVLRLCLNVQYNCKLKRKLKEWFLSLHLLISTSQSSRALSHNIHHQEVVASFRRLIKHKLTLHHRLVLHLWHLPELIT